MIEFLDACIKKWDVDIYRQDFNMDPLDHWRDCDTDERQGITEMKYVEGLYHVWDELVARNPALRIDNCASGGRRIDIETCRRSWPLWRSDFNDIGEGLKGESHRAHMGRADQMHVAGLSLYIPFHAGPVWASTPYEWRSAMASGMTLYGKIEDFDPQITREAVAELKELRPLLRGDYYPLSRVAMAPDLWHAYQLDRPDLGKGCALFFRRPESPYPTFQPHLKAIDEQVQYRITVTGDTYAQGPAEILTGAQLSAKPIAIEEMPGSVLLRYEHVPE